MMVEQRPAWLFLGAPMLLLFLVAAAIILYGLTQPKYRAASLTILGLVAFGVFASAGLHFARSSSHVVVTAHSGAFHQPVVVSRGGFGISPMEIGLVLALVVGGILIYGVTQPKYRAASLTTLGVGLVLLLLGGMTFVAAPVTRVESAAIRVGQELDGQLQIIREQEWTSRTVAAVAEEQGSGGAASAERSPADSLPAISNRIELFEGTRRSGTSLETLPDWISAPVESDPTRKMVDSGPRASFEECQAELMGSTAAELSTRLTARHPQAAGWQPDQESIRRSGAISRRVRETQTVRIDVADSVIREPLYREYWLVESDDKVLDRLMAEWRPNASHQRAMWLARGLGFATLVFGAIAVGIRVSGDGPQPMPA